MGKYLNPNNSRFKKFATDEIFVDKSLIIKETNRVFGTESSFMCVTRPRRFGKTLALSMLNAYYSKGCASAEIFKNLLISKDPSFKRHLNKHNVILVDMASVYTDTKDKANFFEELETRLLDEFQTEFPSLMTTKEDTLAKAITKVSLGLGEKFIFLIDEWDVIYREQERNHKFCDDYTEFLRSLFKSYEVSACFDLVYMTGILPIRRYETESALNMFKEYNMLNPKKLASLFGFTETEVKSLCKQYGTDFSEIKDWYDGYRLDGLEVYNPKSVAEAIENHKCKDYWIQTSATESVVRYMNYDHGALKGAICRMLLGEKVKLDVTEFDNDLSRVDSADAALTVLIHLGYLAYDEDDESCYIPNYEIRTKIEKALKKLDWKEICNPMNNSFELYERTLNGDTEFINASLDENHRDLVSPFSKNNEAILALVVVVSYYHVRQFYIVKQEEIAISGRSDISFIPKDSEHIPFIVELKVGRTPEEAIDQIKRKRYWEAWGNYKGKVLLLGICYDKDNAKHSSKVEYIDL